MNKQPGWFTRISFLTVIIAGLLILLSAAQPSTAQQDAGGPLRVATKPLEPFVFSGPDGPSGFSIDLWDELASRLGQEYVWVEYETVSEILEAVESGEADVAIAGISMTRERETRLDFTHPFFDAGLQIMVSSRPSYSIAEVLRLVFSPGLLLFLAFGLLAAVAMAHVIYFVERRTNPDFQQGYFHGLWEATWYLLAMIANGEHLDKYTKNPVRRILTISYWLIGLLLVAQFTATVTSALTVQTLNSNIQGPEDLPGKRIATVNGTTAALLLEEERIRYTGVDNVADAYPLLLSGEVDAIVYDSPVLQYYSVTEGRGQVTITGPIFKREKYGIALRQGSDLREPLNELLLEMYQDGSLDEIYARWFRE